MLVLVGCHRAVIGGGLRCKQGASSVRNCPCLLEWRDREGQSRRERERGGWGGGVRQPDSVRPPHAPLKLESQTPRGDALQVMGSRESER